MKKVYLIGALLSFGLLAEAQSFMRFEDKAFNFGSKVECLVLETHEALGFC